MKLGRNVTLLLVIMLVLLLPGCTGHRLDGTKWRLVSWSSELPLDQPVTLAFDKGRLSGSTSVNAYSGDYSAFEDGSFAVVDVNTSLLAGSLAKMQVEAEYLQLLGEADTFDTTNGGLTLRGQDGIKLTFTQQ